MKLKKIRAFNKEKIPFIKKAFEYPATKLPIDIEVGCGVGLHPIQYAQGHPKRFLIAIEHTKTKFNKFNNRFLNHTLTNLLPVHSNAISWITHFVPEESIENYFFLYPNPNPKTSSFSKRWHGMPFMFQVLHSLKLGGKIHIATNEKFYAQEAKIYLVNFFKMELEQEQLLPQKGIKYRTHFEKKYFERGEECYNLVFIKKTRSEYSL